jgi:phage terminase large subunit
MIEQSFNELYEPLFAKPSKRYNHLLGGRGRGGSHTGTDYYLHLITQKKYFRGYIMREIFGDIKESLWRDLKDRIEDNPTINEADFHLNEVAMTCTHLRTGNVIIAKGFKKSSSHRTAKLKSIAGATHVMIEEADEIAEEDFMQLDDSLRTVKSDIQIILIYNPPHKNHWFWKRWFTLLESTERILDQQGKLLPFFIPVPNSDDNLLAIHSTYEDNDDNLNESTLNNFIKYKETKPDYYGNIIRGLVPEGVRGRVYSHWKQCDELPTAGIQTSTLGLDWGFNDPLACVKVIETKSAVYIDEVCFERGWTNPQLSERLTAYGIGSYEEIWADCADPKSIEDLSALGWNIKAISKPPGSVLYGIKHCQEKQVFVTKRSKNVWLAYENYAWALNQYKEPTEMPAHKWSDLMDAFRYGKVGGAYPSGLIIHSGKKETPRSQRTI